VLVPLFAVGRTQILLYLLAGAFKRGTLNPFPVFLDSPMGIRATEIYRSHTELFDEEALAMRASGELSANLRTVKVCQKPVESLALAKKPGPFLVMAGAGMCNGGRILHHLQNHLPDPDPVDAGRLSVARLPGAAAAGGRPRGADCRRAPAGARPCPHVQRPERGTRAVRDLLAWMGSLAPLRPRVILTHGEDGPRSALRDGIQAEFGLAAEMPANRQTIEI
jgi:metallo-beta-lactamase family protein